MALSDLSKLTIERMPGKKKSPAARRRWTRVLFALCLAGIVAALIVARMNAPLEVEITTVAMTYPSQSYTVLNATGYVVPQRKAAVSSKAQGRLEWLGVLEGSLVKKDEIIARLENNDMRASLDQVAAQVNVARANLEQGRAELQDAEANVRRSADLLAKNFISSAQHETNVARHAKAKAAIRGLQASIVSAEANVRAAQVAFDQTVIRAPFDGVVLTKNANVGDNITPFSSATDSKGAVVTMADLETLEVEADVSESNIANLKPGQPCEIKLDALADARLPGMVSRIVPTVDRAKATVLVKVRFVERDPRVLPDMSAKVAFLTQVVPEAERKPVIAVQAAAITDRAGRKLVFRVRDDVIEEVIVTTGAKIGELISVQGVAAGDKLVLRPSDKVRSGARVKIPKS
jgi:RND family efflux transporter MFP subunit